MAPGATGGLLTAASRPVWCSKRGERASVSGLMRNVVDQVLRTMSEKERAEQVNYVTDRMIERMGNEERVSLLLAIIDRVMSNLSPQERAGLASRVTERMTAATRSTGDAAQGIVAPTAPAIDPDAAVRPGDGGTPAGVGEVGEPVAATEPPHPRERD